MKTIPLFIGLVYYCNSFQLNCPVHMKDSSSSRKVCADRSVDARRRQGGWRSCFSISPPSLSRRRMGRL